MTFNLDLKTLVSFLISVGLVTFQAVQGVYSNGITGIEWLGIAAVVFGPAGLVAAVNNTPWSPATKALAQHVSTVAVVLIQGLEGVYNHGITGTEWLGLGMLFLSTLAVYFVPGSPTPALAGKHMKNEAGFGSILGTLGGLLLLVAVILFITTLLKVFVVSIPLLIVTAIIGVVLLFLDGRSRGGPVL